MCNDTLRSTFLTEFFEYMRDIPKKGHALDLFEARRNRTFFFQSIVPNTKRIRLLSIGVKCQLSTVSQFVVERFRELVQQQI